MNIQVVPNWFRHNGLQLCWILAAASIAIVMARIAFFMPVPPKWIDSYAFIGAGQALLDHRDQIYTEAIAQAQTGLPTQAFLYPPSALELFAPFGWLADRAGLSIAAVAWLVVEATAMATGLLLWMRACDLKTRVAAPLALILATSMPIVSDLNSGQANGVTILLATLAAMTFPTKRSALFLGLVLAFKPVLFPLLLIPLVLGRWRLALLALATGLALLVPMIPLLGSKAVVDYFTAIAPPIAANVLQDANNISAVNLITTWIGGRPPYRHSQFGIAPWQFGDLATALIVLLRLGFLALAARLAWFRREPRVLFAAGMAVTPILASTTWLHYLTFAFPLLIVAMSRPPIEKTKLVMGALVFMLLDPALNIVFVNDWGVPPTLVDITTFVRIEILGVALTGFVAIAFWKLGSGRDGPRLRLIGSRDKVGSNFPRSEGEDNSRDDVNDVVLA